MSEPTASAFLVCGSPGWVSPRNRCILFNCVLANRLSAERGPETNKSHLFPFTEFFPEARVPHAYEALCVCRTGFDGSHQKLREKRSDQTMPTSKW